jgi:hypothetical protein
MIRVRFNQVEKFRKNGCAGVYTLFSGLPSTQMKHTLMILLCSASVCKGVCQTHKKLKLMGIFLITN